MTTKAPPSLGDAPEVELKTVREEYAAPQSRKELLIAIERILAGGGVQKLVVQYGEPIRVSRRVKADAPGEAIPEELALDEDIMAATRNAPMEALTYSEPLTPFEYLLRSFNVLFNRKLYPKAVLVNRTSELESWTGIRPLNSLFTVSIFEYKEMPEDSILLVGAKVDDPDTVALSLRLTMDRKPKRKKTEQ